MLIVLLIYVFLSQIRCSVKLCSIAVFKRVYGTVTQCSYAIEHPPCRCSLCWQELFCSCDLLLFGQANHNYRQKKFFFFFFGVAVVAHPLQWRSDSSFTLQDWQLVLPYIARGVGGRMQDAIISSGISELGETFLVSEGSRLAKALLDPERDFLCCNPVA